MQKPHPKAEEYYTALLGKDKNYDGLFFAGQRARRANLS